MTEFKEYSLSEVAIRNGKGSQPLWVVYKDSVYDLTQYLNQHPGGVDAIVDGAGKDMTKDFDGVGHSSDAKQILAQYKVGEIVENEKLYDANGKKKKRVVAAPPGKPQPRSCINIITCGLVG